MNWKYIRNFKNSDNFAEMFLYSEIGIGEGLLNGTWFAYELNYLLNYSEAKEIRIRINSVGGNVVEGIAIFSAIINARASHPDKEVNTFIDGLAASIAGVIWAAGKNRYMKDYSQLMVHGLNMPDTDLNSLSPNDKAAYESLQDMVITALSNGTDSNKEFISILFSNGKDNWYNSTQAVSLGFIAAENVENTGVEIESPEIITAKVFVNRANDVINNKNEIKMKKLLAKLDLSNEASEDAAVGALEKLQNKTTVLEAAKNKAETDLADEKQKNADLTAKLDEAETVAATAVVKEAINAGKFDQEKETELVVTAKKDLNGFKNLVASIPTRSKNIMDSVQNKGEEAKGLIARVQNRTFRELEKADPKLLSELKNSATQTYVDLYNAQYKTAKTVEDF